MTVDSVSAGCIFTLAGFLLLLAQILMNDILIACRAISEQIEADFGHDTKIFPDYQPYTNHEIHTDHPE